MPDRRWKRQGKAAFAKKHPAAAALLQVPNTDR